MSEKATDLEPPDDFHSPGSEPLFVLGMHRSGTSAFAGALHGLGVSFGSELIAPVAGVNERGYYEDARVLALHEDLLAHLSRSWRHPLPLPGGWPQQKALEPFAKRARVLLDDFCSGRRWGLKDPRLCLLLPLWQRLLAERNLTPRALITLRHPSQVAASLARRDQLPEELSCYLWSLHYLYAERHTRGISRRLESYDSLLQHPERTLDELADWLKLTPSAPDRERARAFLTRSLSHHRNVDLPENELVRSLWNILAGSDLDSSETRLALDELGAELEQALRALGPVLGAQADQIGRWESEFAHASRQLEASRSALVGFETAVDELRERDQQLAELSDHFAEAARPLELSGETLQGFEAAVAQLEARNAEVLALREQVALLQALRRSALAGNVDRKADAQTNPLIVGATRQDRDYHGHVDLRVENNSHTRAIRYINETGSPERGPILEVGCSTGYVGEVLRSQRYRVWGVETNAAAVVEALRRLDNVFHGTIEDFAADPAFENVRFQFVIFGDVLEHLLDPAAVLRECKKLLAPGGGLVISVPNVAHRAVRLMLMEGRWDYDTTGILDSTHLHFYTGDSLIDLFTATGYAVERFSAIRLPAEQTGVRFNPQLEAALDAHLQDNEQDVFQFVALLRDGAEDDLTAHNGRFQVKHRLRILCLPPVESSSLFSIRLGDPLTRLTELYGGELRVREPHCVRDEDVEWADTIVLQRESNKFVLNLMRRAKAAGKRVIFDIDDLLTDVPDYLSVAEQTRRMKPWLEQALTEADAVSVSTPELREAFRAYNPATFITPNYAYSGEPPIAHYPSDDPVRILIASSDTARVDVLVDSLRSICADPSLDVELVGIGPPGEYLLAQGLPISATPTMPHSQFKSFLAERNNTIALIPLDDNHFNRCKSPIKFFDYALAGVPCICSAVITYSSVIDDSADGILCQDDETHWTSAIQALVADPARRAKMAEQARQSCLERHNLNLTAAAWQEIIHYVGSLETVPVCEPLGHIELRSHRQLIMGTLRHLVKPGSHRSAWRLYRKEGLAGVRARWRKVF